MKTIILINACSEGTIVTNGNDIVVKLVDEKNALLSEYLFKSEIIKSNSTLYYLADKSHIHFQVDIMPSETKEIVCVN